MSNILILSVFMMHIRFSFSRNIFRYSINKVMNKNTLVYLVLAATVLTSVYYATSEKKD